MATIHIGRMRGPYGFSRTVAIKRLHPQFAQNPQFVAMFTDEARLAVRIRHANVISPLDVVVAESELFIVMEYVNGESLSTLLQTSNEPLSPALASAIVGQALLGLHAAHEATAEDGTPLAIVHRDASPQNILVGQDGVARVLDFGIAKAAARSQLTEQGKLKGKPGYLAPEQLGAAPAVDRRTDVFTMGIVLWEALTGRLLFGADTLQASALLILYADIRPPSAFNPKVSPELDALVLRALARDPSARFADALGMAVALQKVVSPASPLDVSQWVERWMGDTLARNAKLVRRIEALPLEEQADAPPPAAVDAPGPFSVTVYRPRTAYQRRNPTPGETRLLPSGAEDVAARAATGSGGSPVPARRATPRAAAGVPYGVRPKRSTLVKVGVLTLFLAGAVVAVSVRGNPRAGGGATTTDMPARLDQPRERAELVPPHQASAPPLRPEVPREVPPSAPVPLEAQTAPSPRPDVPSESPAPVRRKGRRKGTDGGQGTSGEKQAKTNTTGGTPAGPAPRPKANSLDDLDNALLTNRTRR